MVVPGCLALGWWQLMRALGGNTLSWAYVFEWPIFAGYAVFMWWKLTHEHRAGTPPRPGARRNDDVVGDRIGEEELVDGTGEEELASYNRYLAALNASDRRKHW